MKKQNLELEYCEHRLRVWRALRIWAFNTYKCAREKEKEAQAEYDRELLNTPECI